MSRIEQLTELAADENMSLTVKRIRDEDWRVELYANFRSGNLLCKMKASGPDLEEVCIDILRQYEVESGGADGYRPERGHAVHVNGEKGIYYVWDVHMVDGWVKVVPSAVEVNMKAEDANPWLVPIQTVTKAEVS